MVDPRVSHARFAVPSTAALTTGPSRVSTASRWLGIESGGYFGGRLARARAVYSASAAVLVNVRDGQLFFFFFLLFFFFCFFFFFSFFFFFFFFFL